MPDGTVSATEANRQFSQLLRDVEQGGRVTITKAGRAVAILVPADAETHRATSSVLDRFKALTDRGLSIDFDGRIERDDLHRR